MRKVRHAVVKRDVLFERCLKLISKRSRLGREFLICNRKHVARHFVSMNSIYPLMNCQNNQITIKVLHQSRKSDLVIVNLHWITVVINDLIDKAKHIFALFKKRNNFLHSTFFQLNCWASTCTKHLRPAKSASFARTLCWKWKRFWGKVGDRIFKERSMLNMLQCDTFYWRKRLKSLESGHFIELPPGSDLLHLFYKKPYITRNKNCKIVTIGAFAIERPWELPSQFLIEKKICSLGVKKL